MHISTARASEGGKKKKAEHGLEHGMEYEICLKHPLKDNFDHAHFNYIASVHILLPSVQIT